MTDKEYIVDTVPLYPESNISVYAEKTGVKVTHKETGLIAQCSSYKSGHKNLKVCMDMLEYGLLEMGVKDDSHM